MLDGLSIHGQAYKVNFRLSARARGTGFRRVWARMGEIV